MAKQYRIMVIGAHPDDCELVGGVVARYLKLGHAVKFLCATNGCSGHHERMGGTMTQTRYQEAQRVAALFKMEYEFLDNDDGFLTPGLPQRFAMLKAIRSFAPDLIFTHRPNDYHPDHRNTSVLVQDCSYLVQVPNVCPTAPVLRYQPAIFYMPDNFQKPYPFQADLVFDITDVFDEKMRMYHQHTSQMYEWLPWVDGVTDVPEGEEERFEWLKRTRGAMFSRWADNWRDALAEKYGDRGKQARYAEALELCEYGGKLTPEQLAAYFPF